MRTLRIVAGVLALCSFAFPQDGFHLKNGDRVVFYGDSITDQRLYSTFTESYVVTRFPKLDVTFVHSGWGGDRVSGGGGGDIDTRLQRDVLPYKPTVMTIMLGMNDGGYKPFDQETFQKFATGYDAIVRKMKAAVPGLRITAIRPSPFDDVTREPNVPGGYNTVLVRYGDFISQLAARERVGVADLNAAVVEALKKAYATDPEGAKKLIPDRVHPGPAGHLLMAAQLLKSWKAPAVITSVTIDGAHASVKESAGTAVTEVKTNGTGSLEWTQLDAALPMPLDLKDAALALALKSSDFVDALDRQPLKVTGLGDGKYTLRIDGDPVGNFTAAELASGINLATLPTPMLAQALEVHALTLKHNNIHFVRWRQLQVPLAKEGLQTEPETLASLDTLEEELIARQRYTAQPKVRRYEIAPERAAEQGAK